MIKNLLLKYSKKYKI